VDLGDLLPNVDGTFQKTSSLHVSPVEWKNNQFSCEVKHQGKTILKILTDQEIKSNNGKLIIVRSVYGTYYDNKRLTNLKISMFYKLN